MRLRTVLWAGCVILTSLCGANGRTEEQASTTQTLLKASGIGIDPKKHEVRLEATICLQQGILEYLVCLPNTFEHEAVFTTQCTPSLLHLSLLAIGVEPCDNANGVEWEKASDKMPKSKMRVEFEYELEGKKVRMSVTDVLKYRKEKLAQKVIPWVFSGSRLGSRDGKRIYAADITGAVIGLGMDDTSVIQYGEQLGNPYKNQEDGFEVDKDKIPAKGTKVQLIFSPMAPAETAGK